MILMKAKIYSIDGTKTKETTLPDIFNEAYRPDIIRRSFLAIQSKTFQAQGVDPLAGLRTTAAFFGRRHKTYRSTNNKSISRTPRIKSANGGMGEVRRIPQSRTGRTAHPPKVEKILIERINTKENRKAIRSAIAATANKDLVIKRGHKVENIEQVPLIIEDKIETITKTKELIDILQKLQLTQELERTATRTIRAGKGKMRGRKYRTKKGALIVTSDNAPILKAATNIRGIETSIARNLNTKLLAPGGDAGRLTIYTESAIAQLGKLFQ